MGGACSKILILLALGLTCRAGGLADRVFKQAEKAERSGDTLQAYLLYARAADLDPSNAEFLSRKNALEALTELTAKTQIDSGAAKVGAAAKPDEARPDEVKSDEVKPDEAKPDEAMQEATAAALAVDDRSPDEIDNSRPALPPVKLTPSKDKASFDLRGDSQSVIEKAAGEFGIQTVFETEYRSTPVFRFQTGELNLEQAFRALEQATDSLIIPVNSNLVLVERDTPQNRMDAVPEMSLEVPIPERISVQDAQDIVNAVQQTLQLRRMSVDPTRRTVYVRDGVSKVLAARQLFSDLARLRAQIEVDVDFISVEKNSALSVGLSWPNSTWLVNFGNFLRNTPSVGSFTQFAGFGGGRTLFGLGVTEAQLFANVSRSSSRTVLHSQVVALDGQAASLNIGDRYPIITNGYYGNATGTGTVYTPPPTVNFEDLGLTLKVTPAIHADGDVTLDIDAEYKLLGSATVNNIPEISQRKYQGKVRLKEGEWAVIAGLAQENESTTTTGFPLLARIPWLGHLFRQDTVNKGSAQILIVLKPHLVTLPPWDFPTQPIWVGSDSRPLALF